MLNFNTNEAHARAIDHILNTYDYRIESLIMDMEAGNGGKPKDIYVTPYHLGKYLAEAGCFLCYNNDMRDTLRQIFDETEEQASKYEDRNVYGIYFHICASACEDIYTRNHRYNYWRRKYGEPKKDQVS